MSNNKYYLRVANSWLQLFAPSGNKRYIANTSGLTIRILLSDTERDTSSIQDENEHYFTVGGSTGQLVGDSTKYIYARAVTDDPVQQGTVVTDTESINDDDLGNIRESIEFLTTQLIRLSERVTSEEMKTIDHGVDYEIFVRQFLDTTAQHHIQFSAIHKHIATIWEELLLAEKFIQRHRTEYATIREMIDNIRNGDNASLRAEVELLKIDVTNILGNYANVVENINDLQDELATTNQKYDNILTDEISPLRRKLTELMNNLAALNNAIVVMTTDHSISEINDIFSDYIATVPESMVAPVTAIKNDIISIISGGSSGGLSSDNIYHIKSDTDTLETFDITTP